MDRLTSLRARLGPHRAWVAVTGLLVLLAGCEIDPNQRLVAFGEFRLEPDRFENLEGWADDPMLDVVPALRRSCEAFGAGDPSRPLGLAGRAGTYGDWRPVCAALATARLASDTDVRLFAEEWFLPFKLVTQSAREGVVTGYAEATVDGALNESGIHRYPIYAVPPNMFDVDPLEAAEDWPPEIVRGHVVDFQLQPFYDRQAIDNGALSGRGLELVWVDDPLDLYQLHQLGEGVVVLGSGERRRLEAVADNGHPRASLMRTLIARGVLPREGASWAAAREWLDAHPAEAESMLRQIRWYPFFAWSQDQVGGPVGALDTPLTPGRSLAVDINVLPLGVPIWIDVAGVTRGAPRIRRLTVAQDIEAGVTGFISGSLFWGAGEEAVANAAAMNSAGRMHILLPRVAGFQ